MQVVQFIDFLLIHFLKMMGSYKFPEQFEQIVEADGLQGEMLVADPEVNTRLCIKEDREAKRRVSLGRSVLHLKK